MAASNHGEHTEEIYIVSGMKPEIAKSRTPRKRLTRFALQLVVVIAIAVGAPAAQGQDKQIIVPPLFGDALAGQTVFARHCQTCHGVNMSGSDKGPTLIHRVYHPGHHNDASIYIAVRRGSRQHHWRFGNMKPIDGISDAEIAQVIVYIRAVQKANGLF